jgi:hypothetical protein
MPSEEQFIFGIDKTYFDERRMEDEKVNKRKKC